MAEHKPKKDTPPEAMKSTFHEETVPVNVGMDKDDMAHAETQNRQVGVDDSKEIRETLHDAAKEHGETVDIKVQVKDGEPLPKAAQQAIADKDAPAPSGSTRAAMPGSHDPTDDPLNDGGLHQVSLNGVNYSWRDGEEGSVPAEAVEIYKRAVEANTP